MVGTSGEAARQRYGPEYRIVVREVGGTIEIIEVVTVEERAEHTPSGSTGTPHRVRRAHATVDDDRGALRG